MAAMANANQKTSSGPSYRKGTKPSTVDRMVSMMGMILWLYAFR